MTTTYEAAGTYRVDGLSQGKRYAASGMTATVHTGDGADMTISNPQSFEDGGAEWVMRYGNPASIRYSVASLLGSYDYLLSDGITMTEATRRLRLLRAARRSLSDEL